MDLRTRLCCTRQLISHGLGHTAGRTPHLHTHTHAHPARTTTHHTLPRLCTVVTTHCARGSRLRIARGPLSHHAARAARTHTPGHCTRFTFGTWFAIFAVRHVRGSFLRLPHRTPAATHGIYRFPRFGYTHLGLCGVTNNFFFFFFDIQLGWFSSAQFLVQVATHTARSYRTSAHLRYSTPFPCTRFVDYYPPHLPPHTTYIHMTPGSAPTTHTLATHTSCLLPPHTCHTPPRTTHRTTCTPHTFYAPHFTGSFHTFWLPSHAHIACGLFLLVRTLVLLQHCFAPFSLSYALRTRAFARDNIRFTRCHLHFYLYLPVRTLCGCRFHTTLYTHLLLPSRTFPHTHRTYTILFRWLDRTLLVHGCPRAVTPLRTFMPLWLVIHLFVTHGCPHSHLRLPTLRLRSTHRVLCAGTFYAILLLHHCLQFYLPSHTLLHTQLPPTHPPLAAHTHTHFVPCTAFAPSAFPTFVHTPPIVACSCLFLCSLLDSLLLLFLGSSPPLPHCWW